MPAIPPKLAQTIRNLMQLAESPYAAEARSARRKVDGLLSKYATSLEELGLAGRSEWDIPVLDGDDAGPWQERLLKIMSRAAGVEASVLNRGSARSYRLSGPESTIASLAALYGYLENRLLTISSEFAPCIDDLESFRLGILEGITPRLEALLIRIRRLAPRSPKACEPVFADAAGAEETEEWDDWYGVDENSCGLGRAVGRKIPVNLPIGT